MKRFSVTLLALVLFVALSETALRLAGVVLLAPTLRANQVLPGDREKVRILALGESTTADYFSDSEECAWPRQLERMLEKAGVPARVYNEGLGATTTAMILSRTPEFIEKYQPQIAIAMMGINDTNSFYFDGSQTSKMRLALTRLRVVRLLGWLYKRVVPSGKSTFDMEFLAPIYVQAVEQLAQRLVDQPVHEVEAALRKVVPDVLNLSKALTYIGTMRLGASEHADSFLKAAPFFDRAYQIMPASHYVTYWQMLLNRHPSRSQKRCPEEGAKILDAFENVPDDLLSVIGDCAAGDPRLASHTAFAGRGIVISPSATPPTKMHYCGVATILRKSGIQFMAMQYPTLPTRELREQLTACENTDEPGFLRLEYISNEKNFSDSLKARPYAAVFVDRFRGSWGHTTCLGHELIAEAAFQAVRKRFEKE